MPSLSIAFVEAVPAPPLGYVVKFKEMSHVLFTTLTPNPMGSPAVIPNLPAGRKWEGTIQAQMDTNMFCAPVRFTYDDSENAMTKTEGRVASTIVGVCSAPYQSLYSNDIEPDGVPVIGAEIFFDFDGLVSIGNGYISGLDGKVYEVVNGIVTVDTGQVCPI